MSDVSYDIYNFSIYKKFSLNLLESFLYFFIVCVICGNISICLSKVSLSDLLSEFLVLIETNIIKQIISSDTDPTKIYDAYDLKQRNTKLEQVFTSYCKMENHIIKSLNYDNENIQKLIHTGSQTKIQFDLVYSKDKIKSKSQEEYYLVYYKFKEVFIKNFLQRVYNTFYNSNNIWIFFSFFYLQLLIFSIKMAQCYIYILQLIVSIVTERGLLLIFVIYPLLQWIKASLVVVIMLCFMIYFIIYFCYNCTYLFWGFYKLFFDICDYVNNIVGVNKATSIWDLALTLSYYSFYLWAIVFMVVLFIVILCLFFACIGIYIVAYLFLLSSGAWLALVIFYGIIRVCLVGIQGFFVESCDPSCDSKSEFYVFHGENEFNTTESIFFTFLKYLKTYFVLYTIFLLFPTTQEVFGSNVIVPFIILFIICYYFIDKAMSNIKQTLLTQTLTADEQNTLAAKQMSENPSVGNIIFGYLLGNKSTTKEKE